MSKAAMNLQDSFLNQVRRENNEVNVLLVNGKSLRGTVKGFDNFTVILNSRGGQHLVYKHAIAQVVSQKQITGRKEGEEGVAEGAETREGGEQRHDRRDHQQQQKPQQQKKDSFNALDLSQIKLSEAATE